MDKYEFFQDLEEIVTDPIFIGNLNEEIENNTWSISISNELAVEIMVDDFKIFFDRVVANRKKQVENSNSPKMLFYVWFDWMAVQLRFSVISDDNAKLPFAGEVEITENLELIIEDFLRFPYHDEIVLEEVQVDESEINEEDEAKKKLLKVFLIKV